MQALYDGNYYNDYHCEEDFELDGDWGKYGEKVTFDMEINLMTPKSWSLRPVFKNQKIKKKKSHLLHDVLRVFHADIGISDSIDYDTFAEFLYKLFGDIEFLKYLF